MKPITTLSMRHILPLLLLLLHPLQLRAADSCQAVLRRLDTILKQEQHYEDARHRQIDSLHSLLSRQPAPTHPRLHRQLQELYYHYQNDSALAYAYLLYHDALRRDDRAALVDAGIRTSLCLGVMGAYGDAFHKLDTLSALVEGREERTRYFHAYRTLFGWASAYLSEIPVTRDVLRARTDAWRDSILVCDEDSVSRQVCLADRLISQGRLEEAERLLKRLEPHTTGEHRAYTLYSLAQVYQGLGCEDREVCYLALASICDAERAVKECAALQELAYLLYRRGDVERAYRYVMQALDDAAFCNARLRTASINRIFPIINRAYQEVVQSQQRVAYVWICVAVLLVLMIVSLLINLYRRNKVLHGARLQLCRANEQLEDANGKLEQTNATLEQANRDLAAADKVKEHYITIYLERFRGYMDQVNNGRMLLLKYARAGQTQRIVKELEAGNYLDEEKKKFLADFDVAFLNIHPHFIEHFNALLAPEHKLEAKADGRLSAELRIFALIRLGITDINDIASFLGYSVPTIYQYRSRVRSHSVLSKQEFEERILVV